MLSQPQKRISVKKREGQSLFFKIVYFFLLFAFAGVVIYILIFSLFLRVNYLNLEGVEELEYEKVYNKLESLLDGKYLWIFPKDNFLLVLSGKIKKELAGEFKKIRQVEVEKNFPDTINVKIEERESLILWCSKGPCYIIDEQGYAYAWADFESREIKENNLVRLVDMSAKPIDIGEKILDEDYVKFVTEIREKLKRELNIKISDEYSTTTKLSEVIKINTNDGWDIHLSSQIPLDQSIRTLKTFLEQKITDEIKKELEYVDLRVENKIYYKVKNSDEEAPTLDKDKVGDPTAERVGQDNKKDTEE
ncbi:cell division protein FtsQ [bacterium BMS3Abin15]|nr:cell division protein FtsQ [bacterium BMS3Abin15]HDH07791.1 FtsQ-type POTRA domain-containing protein [Candidatus Moranbacteria bacterium]HDZ85307.1 FtsQ-type POTRA domain-containing protein [Candidatus Moranbacteria bacterium]